MSTMTTIVNTLKTGTIARAITPSDDDTTALSATPPGCLNEYPRAFRCGDAGVIVWKDHQDVSSTINAVAAGETFEFSPKYIMATGTTVTDIIGYW